MVLSDGLNVQLAVINASTECGLVHISQEEF